MRSIDEEEYYVIIDENGSKKVEVNENYLDVILTVEKDENTKEVLNKLWFYINMSKSRNISKYTKLKESLT